MKKILLLTAIIFTVFVSSFEVKAQDPCPPGSFEMSVSDNGFPGCPNLKVTFCVECDVANPGINITIKSISGVCAPNQIPSYLDYLSALTLSKLCYVLYITVDTV